MPYFCLLVVLLSNHSGCPEDQILFKICVFIFTVNSKRNEIGHTSILQPPHICVHLNLKRNKPAECNICEESLLFYNFEKLEIKTALDQSVQWRSHVSAQGASGWALQRETSRDSGVCLWEKQLTTICHNNPTVGYILAILRGLWDLSFLTRVPTWALGSENTVLNTVLQGNSPTAGF